MIKSDLYTNADRRNYYWLYIATSSIDFPDVFAGPWETDAHCEPIGLSNHFYYHAKGCLNNSDDGTPCDEAKFTNKVQVPREACRISGDVR